MFYINGARGALVVELCFNALTSLLITVFVSVMDGLYVEIWVKRMIIISFTVVWILGSVYYDVYGPDIFANQSIMVSGYEVPLLSLSNSYSRTVTLFFVKQSVSMLVNRHKATVIKKPLMIHWI